MATQKRSSRRGLLLGAAGLTALAWSWQRFGVRSVNLAFEPIPGLEGWSYAVSGEMTAVGGNATSAVLVGIDDNRVDPLPKGELCRALYQTEGLGRQIAVFTDHFCPNCHILDISLSARSDVQITWHELPLLGPNSEIVARGKLAAALQGGYQAFRTSLLKAPFRPSAHGIQLLAEDAGLDAAQLLRDMDSAAVSKRLAQSRAAAETLGIWGTPAVAIGQNLVLGRITSERFDELLEETPKSCV